MRMYVQMTADSARKSTKMKRGFDNSIAPMLHRPQNGSTLVRMQEKNEDYMLFRVAEVIA